MLGENIKKARIERKISQRALARAVGVSESVLSHYENETRKPTLEFVKKIADCLGCEARELLGNYKLTDIDEFNELALARGLTYGQLQALETLKKVDLIGGVNVL